jgi:hypothetical protein
MIVLSVDTKRLNKLPFDELELQKDKLLRVVAQTSLFVLQDRIFTDQGGRKTDGSPIGTYTPKYLAYRKKVLKKNNTQVNLNATGQMFQDLDIAPDGESYTLGFKNSLNKQKADWNEERFGTIFQLSQDEVKEYIEPAVQEFIDNLFKK